MMKVTKKAVAAAEKTIEVTRLTLERAFRDWVIDVRVNGRVDSERDVAAQSADDAAHEYTDVLLRYLDVDA